MSFGFVMSTVRHTGQDALTHSPGDVDGLTRCLERLADDPALRARLGAAARQSALRQFDPDQFTRAFIEVYEAAALRARC